MPSLARTIIRSGLITGSVPGCSYSVTSFQAALESPFSKSVHTAISPSAALFDLPRCLLLFLIGLLFVVVKSNTKYPTCQACFFIFFIPFSGKGSFSLYFWSKSCYCQVILSFSHSFIEYHHLSYHCGLHLIKPGKLPLSIASVHRSCHPLLSSRF